MAEEKTWWEKTKDWGAGMFDSINDAGNKAVDKTKEYAGKAQDAITDYGQQADDASGGWLGKNKGLVIGGAVALLALFGMDGGAWPMVLAVGALIFGIFMDKDTGIFSGKEDKKSNGNGQAIVKDGVGVETGKATGAPAAGASQSQQTNETPPTQNVAPPTNQPAPPDTTITEFAPDLKKQVYLPQKRELAALETIIHVDTKGRSVLNPEANLMEIRVNKEGKVTGVAVADEKGNFDRNQAGDIIAEIPADKNVSFKVTKDDSSPFGNINLGEKLSQDKLKELRDIGTKAREERVKPAGKKMSFSDGDLGTLSPIPNFPKADGLVRSIDV